MGRRELRHARRRRGRFRSGGVAAGQRHAARKSGPGSNGFTEKESPAQTEETRLSQLQQRSWTRSRREGRQWQACKQSRRQGVEGEQPAVRIEDRGWKIEDRGSRIEDRGSKVEDCAISSVDIKGEFFRSLSRRDSGY